MGAFRSNRAGDAVPIVTALVAFLAVGLVAAVPARAIPNSDCLECHSSPEMQKTLPNGVVVSLYVGEEFGRSIHGQFACTDCHADATEIPHADSLAKVDCSTCHGDVQEQYLGSVHGKAKTAGNADAPGCADCHGTHGIQPAADSTSSVNPRRLPFTCAR